MDSWELGALGFWIFVATAVATSTWSSSRRETEKHETLRRIVEKTGVIDEARLKDLFSAAPPEDGKPGDVYRYLRIVGAIVIFTGVGIAAFFVIPTLIGHALEWWYGGLGISVGVVLIGLGIFFSSRFAEPPPGARNEPPAR
jgi:hypothetical protein